MWVNFTIDTTINLTNYVIDLQKRFEQFNKLISLPSYQNSGVWFGGLLFPEAYMTASLVNSWHSATDGRSRSCSFALRS